MFFFLFAQSYCLAGQPCKEIARPNASEITWISNVLYESIVARLVLFSI